MSIQGAFAGSTAQIIDQQNASSGMWAAGERMEVMYMVVVLYVIWPIVFNIVAGLQRKMGNSGREKQIPHPQRDSDNLRESKSSPRKGKP